MEARSGSGSVLSTSARSPRNLEPIRRRMREGDVVIVHDPQPAGLIAPLVGIGRPRRLALSCGLRRIERVDRACLGIHAPLCRGCECACVLTRVVRAGMDRPCVAAGHTTLDRSVHSQEQGTRSKRGLRAPRSRRARLLQWHPARRPSASKGGRCARGPSARSRGSARRAGLPLGPDEGHGRRARGVRTARTCVACAPRAGRARSNGCERRSRGRGGLERDGLGLEVALEGRSGSHPSRLHPDGRSGRERDRHQCSSAARRRRRAEEPRRGLRAHRGRGDVEEASRRRNRRRRHRRSGDPR